MIALCGTRPAFEELAAPLLKELRGAALVLAHDPAAADDLVQETLFKAYRAYDRFEPGTNFKAWLHRILYNTFVSDFRKRRDHNELPLPEDLDTPDRPPAPDVTSRDVGALCERLDDRMKRAIAKMNPDFREVFLRAAIDDATNEEIAEALHLPVGTVMSRMHRARAFLRHELSTPQ